MDLDKIKTELRGKVPDFAAMVAPVYAVLGWEWSPGESQPHIPPVGEIENTLYECIEGLSDECHTNGTGGLDAYYEMPDENEPGYFGLLLGIADQEFFDR